MQTTKYPLFFSCLFSNIETLNKQEKNTQTGGESIKKHDSEQISLELNDFNEQKNNISNIKKNTKLFFLRPEVIKMSIIILLCIIYYNIYYKSTYIFNKTIKMLLKTENKPINKFFCLEKSKKGLSIGFCPTLKKPTAVFYYNDEVFFESCLMSKILSTIFFSLSGKSMLRFYKSDIYLTKDFCTNLKDVFANFFFLDKKNPSNLISNQDYFDNLNSKKQKKSKFMNKDKKNTKLFKYFFLLIEQKKPAQQENILGKKKKQKLLIEQKQKEECIRLYNLGRADKDWLLWVETFLEILPNKQRLNNIKKKITKEIDKEIKEIDKEIQKKQEACLSLAKIEKKDGSLALEREAFLKNLSIRLNNIKQQITKEIEKEIEKQKRDMSQIKLCELARQQEGLFLDLEPFMKNLSSKKRLNEIQKEIIKKIEQQQKDLKKFSHWSAQQENRNERSLFKESLLSEKRLDELKQQITKEIKKEIKEQKADILKLRLYEWLGHQEYFFLTDEQKTLLQKNISSEKKLDQRKEKITTTTEDAKKETAKYILKETLCDWVLEQQEVFLSKMSEFMQYLKIEETSQITNWIKEQKIFEFSEFINVVFKEDKAVFLKEIQKTVFLRILEKKTELNDPKESVVSSFSKGLNDVFLNSFFQIYLKDLMVSFEDHNTLIPQQRIFYKHDFSPDFLHEMKNLYTKINFFIGEEEGKQVIFEISPDKTSVTRTENREKEQEILDILEEKRNKLFEKILFKKDIFDLIESDSKEIENLIQGK